MPVRAPSANGARPPLQAPMTNSALPLEPRPLPPLPSPPRDDVLTAAFWNFHSRPRSANCPGERAGGAERARARESSVTPGGGRARPLLRVRPREEVEEGGRIWNQPMTTLVEIWIAAQPGKGEGRARREGCGPCSSEEKTEVERGQNGREGCCIPAPTGVSFGFLQPLSRHRRRPSRASRFHIPAFRSCHALRLGLAPKGRGEVSDPWALLV